MSEPVYVDRFGRVVEDIGEPMEPPPNATWADCLRAIQIHGWRKVTSFPDFDVRRVEP